MVRVGQTEGSVDLARLAGLKPAGVICEIMDEDGTMARMPSLEKFSETHGIGICTIADLVEYRMRKESLSTGPRGPNSHPGTAIFGPSPTKTMWTTCTTSPWSRARSIRSEPVLVRVHSECLTGDIFGSMRCDCGDQLHKAMA
jgi:3,4-dihydroxy 2-butanone 4-phosphate synthase / GTP cyclohydrolase II